MKRTLGDAAAAVGGQLVGADHPYGAVATDSRTLQPGSLFVALRGPNFDGGEFVAAAAAQGAIGALVARAVPDAIPQIVVPDTLRALQALGQAWRSQFTMPVVAVGGSNGKTTAKEMTAAILSRMGLCMATRGNLNNHIGVPVTLMRLEATHRSAVVEMGANRIGDVAELVRLARPTVGLITNAGAEHLEGFGNLDGVAQGEGEMVSCLDPGATGIINADDAYAGYWRKVAAARRIVTFGIHADADFMAKNPLQAIERGEFATRFTLVCPLGERPITLKAGGMHNVGNALAAAAAAGAAGASLDEIVAGLADFRAVAGRLQLKPEPATAGSSMTPTTPTRVRCAPVSRCCAHCRARPGWCSATWPNSASTPKTAMPTWAPMRAIAASNACSRWVRRVHVRSRPLARAASGSRMPTR